jgi:hypothetical protein
LAGGDLRAVRLLVEQLEARNELIGLVVGFTAAAAAAVASYLWLERRASAVRRPEPAAADHRRRTASVNEIDK